MRQISSKEVISTLKKQQWQVLPKRGKGSHTALRNPEGQLVIVPHAKSLAIGTLKSIERTTGICFADKS